MCMKQEHEKTVLKNSALGHIFILQSLQLHHKYISVLYVPFIFHFVIFLSAHGFGCKYTVGPSEKPQSFCRNIGGEHHEHTKQNYTLCLYRINLKEFFLFIQLSN